MPDVFGLLSKLFSNEPLERLMYMLIIFVLILLLMPDSVPEYVQDKISIPYIYPVFVFAFSFVLAINLQRLALFLRKIWRSHRNNTREQKIISHINAVIDSLTAGQKKILITALSRNYPVIHAVRNDSDIKKLVSANILLPMEGQLLPNENPYCVLHINDIFWRALMLRWNAYSGEIE
ncbi:TPA: hypothetical protein H2114_002879 [Escherichia coli]|nr:hypothetical protein [Escherichia coli]